MIFRWWVIFHWCGKPGSGGVYCPCRLWSTALEEGIGGFSFFPRVSYGLVDLLADHQGTYRLCLKLNAWCVRLTFRGLSCS